MSGVSIKVEAKQAKSQLRKFGQDFSESKILNAIGLRQLNWVDQNFKDEGTEEKWKPLKPATILARKKKGTGSNILRDKNKLAESFVSRVRGKKVSVGTNKKYAKRHEFGTEHIPIRKMLPSKRVAEKLAVGVLKAIVDKAAKEVSRGRT